MLSVRLTPRSSRDEIEGIGVLSDGSCVLSARVRAAPDKGAANAALLELIARVLKAPRSTVVLQAGATARLKSVWLNGEPDALLACLEASFGDQS